MLAYSRHPWYFAESLKENIIWMISASQDLSTCDLRPGATFMDYWIYLFYFIEGGMLVAVMVAVALY